MIQNISRVGRDRLCRSFKQVSFPAGHLLYQENEFAKWAYIVIRGEVELFESKKAGKEGQTAEENNMNSTVVNKNQLKKIVFEKKGKLQWVGEESFLAR